jgi:curved DNA-binding protein CbpA
MNFDDEWPLSPSFYEVLSVGEDSDLATIRSAWRDAVVRTHPDRGGSDEQFLEVQRAFEVLGNEPSRRAYDSFLKQQRLLGRGHEARQSRPEWDDWSEDDFRRFEDQLADLARLQEILQNQINAQRARGPSKPKPPTSRPETPAVRRRKSDRQFWKIAVVATLVEFSIWLSVAACSSGAMNFLEFRVRNSAGQLAVSLPPFPHPSEYKSALLFGWLYCLPVAYVIIRFWQPMRPWGKGLTLLGIFILGCAAPGVVHGVPLAWVTAIVVIAGLIALRAIQARPSAGSVLISRADYKPRQL